jgi:hypothetical protein
MVDEAMRQQNKQRMTGGVCSVATEGKSAAITPGKKIKLRLSRSSGITKTS